MSQVRTGSVLAAILASPTLAAVCGLIPDDGLDQRVEIIVRKSGPQTAIVTAIPPALRLLITGTMITEFHDWIPELEMATTHRLAFRPKQEPSASIDGRPPDQAARLLRIDELVKYGKNLCAALERAVQALNKYELGKFDHDVLRLCRELATHLLSQKRLNHPNFVAYLRAHSVAIVVGQSLLPLDVRNHNRGDQLDLELEGVGTNAGPLTGAYLDHLLTKLMHERGLAMYDASVARAIENHGEVLHTDNHRRTPI